MWRIGDQRVGIVTRVPVLDDDDQPVVSEYMEPETTDSVVWVDGCLFEIQTPTEQQNLTVTTSEIAWAFLPVVGTDVPVIDDDGVRSSVPVVDITADQVLRDAATGRDYVMRGDAVMEHGRAPHAFCVCEREQG